jgi:hypothetical protein
MGLANMCECLDRGVHLDVMWIFIYLRASQLLLINFFHFMQAAIPLKKHDLHCKSTFFQKFLKGAIICHIERTFPLIQPLNVEV